MLHFTTCGKINSTGPLQFDAENEYANKDVIVTVHQGIQEWTVPQTGFYLIEAAGASGTSTSDNYSPGKGVELSSIFPLYQYTKLYILVGQQGYTDNCNWGGSGGGATFIAEGVIKSDDILHLGDDNNVPVTLLLAAAGGGGTGDSNSNIEDPNLRSNGNDGYCPDLSIQEGAGNSTEGFGGSGYKTNSEGTYGSKSFLNGGKSGKLPYSDVYGYGGFGGGGVGNNGGGGGAGYKGGDGGNKAEGGDGGYSYTSRTVISCIAKNDGQGYVNIYLINKYLTCKHKTGFSNINPILLIIAFILCKITK